jgi:hypothetical protein
MLQVSINGITDEKAHWGKESDLLCTVNSEMTGITRNFNNNPIKAVFISG